MVSAFKLARQRETVSRPPEKTLSTATAETGKDGEVHAKQTEQETHQGWTRDHMQGNTDWEMKTADPTTTESGCRFQNLLEGASRTQGVHRLVHEVFEIER